MGRREQVTGNTRSTFDRALKESARGFGKSGRERERQQRALGWKSAGCCDKRDRRGALSPPTEKAIFQRGTEVCSALGRHTDGLYSTEGGSKEAFERFSGCCGESAENSSQVLLDVSWTEMVDLFYFYSQNQYCR